MNKLIFVIALPVSLLISGCGGAGATFSKTGDYTAKQRVSDCSFNIYTVPPDKSYKEIGIIEFDGMPSDMPKRVSTVREKSTEEVCANGGNGLLLWEASSYGYYSKATVIYIQK